MNHGIVAYAPNRHSSRSGYCADAELVDRWVGRILQKIDDLDLWDNSIVLFTSDHGMSLGEHNRTGKTNINDRDDRFWPLYPEIAHIPLLIAGPDVKKGHTVKGIAQPVDIMPTLADLAGIKLDPPEPLHGVSFAAQLQGKTKPIRNLAITAEFFGSDVTWPRQGATTPVLYTKKWAYVPLGPTGKAELYDIESDPYAQQDMSGDQPLVVERLHKRLVAWVKDIGAPPATVRALDHVREVR